VREALFRIIASRLPLAMVLDLFAGTGLNAEAVIPNVEGKFASAFIRARKPAA